MPSTARRSTFIALTSATTISLGMLGGCSAAPEPVRVAVVDSGIAADLDAFEGYTIVAETNAVSGSHGTMMASVALGANADAIDPIDPATVEVLSISVDDDGRADARSLAEGIQAAVDDDADVILVSWGVRRDSAQLGSAVQRAHEGGSVVVAAAGNVRFLPADYPARYPDVVSVGAVTADGRRWNSSATASVDTFAIGVDVPVLDAQGRERVESGTSVAAAAVVHDLLRQLADGTITDPAQYQPRRAGGSGT